MTDGCVTGSVVHLSASRMMRCSRIAAVHGIPCSANSENLCVVIGNAIARLNGVAIAESSLFRVAVLGFQNGKQYEITERMHVFTK